MIDNKIAVVGAAYRLPGDIDNDDALWQALIDGKDLVTEVPENRFDKAKFYHSNQNRKGKSYTFSAGVLSDYNSFDYSFFGITAKEASQMDPQQHILLETTWRALEDSGCDPYAYRNTKCGVFVGISSLDFAVCGGADISSSDMYSSTGSAISIAANRISYFFNLKGPSLSIDTACSSSLVALHQACNAIKNGEIDSAIVCGVNYIRSPNFFITQSKAGMVSHSGRCRSFSNSADGYVRSEGCVVIVLKKLEDSLKNQDVIKGIILNTGVNSDGKTNGLPMPNEEAQCDLLNQIYNQINFDRNDLSYIEAHGTGTKIGDPIEVSAISRALAVNRKTPLLIGSIKSNIGHLEPAAGLTGLVKAILCIKHKKIPPTIHCDILNSDIKFDKANIEVVRSIYNIENSCREIVIGVNSFGFGGTNAHVVVAEYKQDENKSEYTDCSSVISVPLVITAETEKSLRKTALKLAELINKSDDIYKIAFNLFKNKAKHRFYAIATGSSKEEIVTAFESFGNGYSMPGNFYSGSIIRNTGKVALVFTGNGCQWSGMGKMLLEHSPEFSKHMIEIDTIFKSISGYSIVDKLQQDITSDLCTRTEFAQPALFVIQAAIVKYLETFGFKYDAVIGHSVGEISAAWACGAISLEDAVKLVYTRSRAQELTKGLGKMAAIGLGDLECSELIAGCKLDSLVEIAGINSPNLTTLSGDSNALLKIQEYAKSKEIYFQLLDIDYPFHSRYMDSIKDRFIEQIDNQIVPTEASIPFVSTVYGDYLQGKKLDSVYWWDNLRQPVEFRKGIELLISEGLSTFIEIGTHPILSRAISQCNPENKYEVNLIRSLQRDSNEVRDLSDLLYKLLLSGFIPGEKIWFNRSADKIDLPGYCWDRKKINDLKSSESLSTVDYRIEHPLLGWRLPGVMIWEKHIDTTNSGFLKDHIVGDSIVLPAAGFIEMAIAVNSLVSDENIGTIENFRILAPLALDSDITIQLQFKLDDGGYFSIRSRPRLTEQEWTIHVKGRLVFKKYTEAVPVLISASDSSFVNKKKIEFDYSAVSSEIGLKYGDSFQVIDKLIVNNFLSKADFIRVNKDKITGKYIFPITLIDGGFQSIISLVRHNQSEEPCQVNRTFLPVTFEKIIFDNHSSSIRKSYSELLLNSKTSLKANLVYFNEEDKAVLSIENARFIAAKLKGYSDDARPDYCEYKPLLFRQSYDKSVSSDLNKNIFKIFSRFEYNQKDNFFEINALLETLTLSYMAEAVRKNFPDVFNPDEKYSEERFEKLHWCLNILILNEFLSEKDRIYSWNKHNEIVPPADIFQLIYKTYSEALPEALYIARFGKLMDKFLFNELDSQDIITPNGGLYHSLHYESVLLKPLLSAFAVSYKKLISGLNPYQKLRVLEVGNGKFSSVLSDIPDSIFDLVEYNLISLDKHHIGKISDRKINTKTVFMNSEEVISDTIFTDNFNLIVCSDLSAFRHKKEIICHISSFLSEGGVLILNENKPSAFRCLLDILKPYNIQSCLNNGKMPVFFSLETWTKTLSECGLNFVRNIESLNESAFGDFFSIFVKENTREQVSSSLVKDKLDKSVLIMHGNSSFKFNSVIDKLKKAYNSIDVGDYREELDTVYDPAKHDVIILYPDQVIAVEDNTADFFLMNLAKKITSSNRIGKKPLLALFTEGGALCNDREYIPISRNPKHASLWALMRVIANEFNSSLDTLMVDIQTEIIPDDITEVLLLANQEIMLSSNAIFELKIVPLKDFLQESPIENDKYIKLELTHKGSLNNLRWTEHIKTAPGKNQVAIKPLSVGLNFRDIMYSLGLIPEEAVEVSSIGPSLGLDVAGVVIGVGEEADDFRPGDKVMGGATSSLATYAITDKSTLFRLPESWSYNQGATVFTVFLTAYYSIINLAQLKKGESILIHGAAGGVGLAAIQIAKHIGAEVFATVGNNEKRELIALLGVNHIYDSRSLYFVDQIRRDTDNVGVDVVLNSLSGEAINASFKVLKPFGRFIEMGKRDIYENNTIELKPFRNNISYFCVNIEQLMLWRKDLGKEIFIKLNEFFNNMIYSPLPYFSYDASRTVEALKFLHDGRNVGKVIVDFNAGSPIAQTRICEKKKLKGYYLITGGTSGFGLETAKYLSVEGLEGLILLSRSGRIDEETFKFFTDKNIKIHVFSLDVTSLNDIETVFGFIDKEQINLKGIIHAATVYNDETINNVTKEAYERVLLTKAKGAAYLDEFSRKYNLDNFIVYSSVTTFFGNIGQANYVAANGFLESLILQRRKLGLKGNYIAFGGLIDTGILTRNMKLKKVLSDKLGNTLITTKQALSALDRILNNDLPGFSVMDFDLPVMQRTVPIIGTSRFDVLRHHQKGHLISKDSGFKDRLKYMSVQEARSELVSILIEEFASIVGLDTSELDEKRPLRDYGMDSLMGFDFIMSIERRTGIVMSAFSLPQSPSISSVAEMILTRVSINVETHIDQIPTNGLLRKHGESDLV